MSTGLHNEGIGYALAVLAAQRWRIDAAVSRKRLRLHPDVTPYRALS